MKYLTLLVLILSVARAFAGIFDHKIAIEGESSVYSVVNGRYSFYETGPDRYTEFRANRTYGEYLSPQKIKWDVSSGRWELRTYRNIGGPISEQVMAISRHASRLLIESGITYKFPPLTGWTCSPVPNPLTAYIPIQLTSIRSYKYQYWDDPAAWSTGSIPRKYDDVIINGFVLIRSNAYCYQLFVGRDFLLRSEGAVTLNVLGDLEIVPWGRLSVHGIRFCGMSRQSLKAIAGGDLVYNRTNFENVAVDNPAGVELYTGSSFHFEERSGPTECTFRFVKGNLFARSYSMVFVEKIMGASNQNFFVLEDSPTLLSILDTRPDFSRTFPVGPTQHLYTPATLTSIESPFRGGRVSVGVNRVADSGTAPGRVNVEYQLPAGRWNVSLGWEPAAESSGYLAGLPVQMKMWRGAWEPVGDAEIPWGVYRDGRYFYSIYEPAIVLDAGTRFGLFQTATTATTAKMSAMATDDKPNQFKSTKPFPNPADKGGFRVWIPNGKTAMTLTDKMGINVEMNATAEAGGMILIKPSEQLQKGIYLLNIEQAGQRKTHRIYFH